MTTEILKSFSHLQSELDEARNHLKGVDENIKRLIGRDPSELISRPGQKRPLDDKNQRQQFPSKFNRNFENDTGKRRNPNSLSVFQRLSDKVPDSEPVKFTTKGGLISKVIAAPKEVPSRQEVLDKQNKDEKFKARNRRMFGALLGTLQKFQQEETKLKKKEEKRTQIEKKIEEHEQQEKEEIKKERQELFLNRKKKQQEIKMIELKMLRMKEYAAWEQTQIPRKHFIVTKAKPHIHFLPRRLNDKSKALLEKSKNDIEEHIEKRRQTVFDELNHIEERMKRNFEQKNHTELKEEEQQEKTTERHGRRGSDSEDDDRDIKMRSPSPEPQENEEKNDTVTETTTNEQVVSNNISDNNCDTNEVSNGETATTKDETEISNNEDEMIVTENQTNTINEITNQNDNDKQQTEEKVEENNIM